MRSLRPPFPPIFPNWSDALTARLVTQADRQQKRPTSRETLPVQRRRAILSRCQKRIRKQRATMLRTSHARRKRGEIRPTGTISREGMRARILRQMVMDLGTGKSIHFFLRKRQERQMVYLSLRFPVSLHITRNKSLGAGMHSPWHVFPPIAPLREAVFRALVCSHVVSENPLFSPQHRIRTCSNQRLICSNGSVACL